MDRILVVDPEESLRLFYARELTEEGYEVITSEKGSPLLDLIAWRPMTFVASRDLMVK